MSLSDAAKAARAKADASIDPIDHRIALALEAAVAAEEAAAFAGRFICVRCGEDVDGTGPDCEWCSDCREECAPPSPEAEGWVSVVRIPPTGPGDN